MKNGTRTKTVERPRSELLFEGYLRAQGLTFEHEGHTGKRKQPDYRVRFGSGDVICEVKELHAGSPRPQGAVFVDPYRKIRQWIQGARVQFKEYKESPCVLVIYNVDDWEFGDWPSIMFGAMLGDAGVEMPFDAAQGMAVWELAREDWLANGEMQRHRNTTFSAVAVLKEFVIPNPAFQIEQASCQDRLSEKLGRKLTLGETFQIGWRLLEEGLPTRLGTCPRLVVFENPFARVPLPGPVFRGDFDERHRIKRGSSRIERVYVGRRLKEVEQLEHGKPELAQEIQRFSREIVEKFAPERIVLFGSHAHDAGGPDSDVDLLVVFSGNGDASRKSLEIRKRLNFALPLDLITYSAHQIQQRLKLGDPFIREVLENGVTLYPRDA